MLQQILNACKIKYCYQYESNLYPLGADPTEWNRSCHKIFKKNISLFHYLYQQLNPPCFFFVCPFWFRTSRALMSLTIMCRWLQLRTVIGLHELKKKEREPTFLIQVQYYRSLWRKACPTNFSTIKVFIMH